MGQILAGFGTTAAAGTLALTGFESWSGAAIVSDVLALGTTNDYSPAGLATARLLRLTPNAGGSALSGIVMQAGHVLTLANIAALGGANIQLLNLNGGSAAGNQFTLPGAIMVITPQTSLTLFGDTVSVLWRNI